jgi:hypothetical protein
MQPKGAEILAALGMGAWAVLITTDALLFVCAWLHAWIKGH